LNAQLALGEIYITALQPDDFAATQSCFTAEEHDQVRHGIEGLRSLDESFVFIEVVEPIDVFGIRNSRIVQGIRSITSHSTAFFKSTLSIVSTLFTVFGARFRKLMLQALDVLIRDGTQPLCPQRGNEVHVEDCLLRCDAAWLLTVRHRVALNESATENFQCQHLLVWLIRTMLQQVPLTVLSPSQCA
jgi:hypothetical protein